MQASPLPSHTDVAIIGAGFAGLGMAIELKRAGREDFVVLDRAEEVGGTWQANTYPGCQCDVPSNLYSFSFAPNPGWSRTFAMQPEIWDYLRKVADDFGVRPHLRLGCEVTACAWDEGAARWRLETSRGALTARVLVAATGGLCEPSSPQLPGIGTSKAPPSTPPAGTTTATCAGGASPSSAPAPPRSRSCPASSRWPRS